MTGPAAGDFELRTFRSNGVALRAAVAGDGPPVILVHGFPELWYSWRHQIGPIAEAGWRVIAPDVRGYGGSDKPEPVAAYDMATMIADVIGLIDAAGAEKAVLIGHDWGAPICWNTAALHPERVTAVAGLSVPHRPRGPAPLIALWRKLYAGRFLYQLYFQAEGVAEAELEADVPAALRKIYFSASGDRPAASQAWLDKGPDARLLEGMIDPSPFPDWLDSGDIAYYADAFRAGGFRGPLNRYRNQERDWEMLPALSKARITPPSCFIAGARDIVRSFVPGSDAYADAGAVCDDFRGTTLIDGEGHWIQQEAPAQVTAALLAFLATRPR